MRRVAIVAVAGAFVLAGVGGCTPRPVAQGQLIVQQDCGQAQCHTLDRVMTAHKNRTQWTDAVYRMRSHGLGVTDQQAATVIEYLSARDARE
jgi:hypothetical protein